MEEYVGMIKLFGGPFCPKGWQYCDGRALSVHSFSALYAVIQDTYGGDGNMFNLPNLNGRAPIGASEQHPLATIGGQETITIAKEQMPAHTHGVAATASLNVSGNEAPLHLAEADKSVLGASTIGAGRQLSPTNSFISEAPSIKLSAKSIAVAVTETVAGENKPLTIMQPYIAMSYIICTDGVMPSRQ